MFSHQLSDTLGRFMFFNMDNVPQVGEEIKTGDWIPALIVNRLPANQAMIVKFRSFDQDVEEILDEGNFCWLDASGITAIEIVGREGDWDAAAEVLGFVVHNGPKLSKRLKEWVRITRYYTASRARLLVLETSEHVPDEKYVDGITYVSRSFADKMDIPHWMNRGNGRYVFNEGLIKGDFIIVNNTQMRKTWGNYDIVTFDVNVKDEFNTTGWTFCTFNPYHAHNQAMFDVQSASWLREWLYPLDLMKDTITRVVDDALQNLRDGNWPSWMMLAEDAHTDDGGLAMSEEMASEAFHRHYLRWQMHGMKPEQSVSIMGMAAYTFISRMRAKYDIRDAQGNWRPQMWIPLPWAFYGHVMTHEALQLAGFTIPNHLRDKLFFHAKTGSVSIPGVEFADTFEAHGTWDLDDSAKFFLRRVSGTDRIVAVIVRSPNSDGEYSIHEIHNIDELPLYHTYGEIPEIDLDDAPKRIEEVLANQSIAGMPQPPRSKSMVYTAQDARDMYAVQQQNPGIGSVANAMMVYYNTFKQSPRVAPATMGDMVDCVQQTPHEEGFELITEFTKRLWASIMKKNMVDEYMAISRMPRRLRNKVTTYKGWMFQLFTHYKNEMNRFNTNSRDIAFRNRMNNPIPELVTLDGLDLQRGGKWVMDAERLFDDIAKKNPGHNQWMRARRTELNRNVVRLMVSKLMEMDPAEAEMLTLAMYRFCTIPGLAKEFRYGRSDRALFSPLPAGETTVMDIFIRGLINIGAAHDIK